jgi:hypothetical protein
MPILSLYTGRGFDRFEVVVIRSTPLPLQYHFDSLTATARTRSDARRAVRLASVTRP